MKRRFYKIILFAVAGITAAGLAVWLGCAGLPFGGEQAYRFQDIGVPVISLEGKWRFAEDPQNRGLALKYHTQTFNDSRWTSITVPATWEEQGITNENPNAKDWLPYGGYAWYRKWVVVPRQWKGCDLRINLGRIDDAGECFFNGKKVGETRSLEEDNVFTISAQTVRFGDKNLVAVKVHDVGGEGGIVSPPVEIEPITPWDRLALRLDAASATYIYFTGERVAFDVIVQNPLARAFDGELFVRFRDFDNMIVYESPLPIRVSADKETRVSCDLPPLGRGHYDVEMTLMHRKLLLKREWSAIAVIDRPIVFKDAAKSPFGLCGGALFHLTLAQHETVGAVRLRQHALVGAYWGRNDLWWGTIEPKKGAFDWTKADSTVEMFERNGIRLLGILCYFSAWSNDIAPRNEGDIKEFVNYARQVVQRYKGRVQYWEVWNEPNLALFYAPKPNPEIYAKLLIETYKAVKQMDPEVKIVGAVTSLTDLQFIEAALKRGAGNAMDIISIHPYQVQPPTDLGEKTELGKIAQLKALLEKYKVNVPIWITECGWQTLGSLTPTIQAEYVVKFYVTQLALGLCERIYWFNLSDWGPRGAASGGHFGLVYMDQSPKPSYVAYYTMVEMLHDFDKAEKVEAPKNVAGFRFCFADRGCVYVYWAEKGTEEVRLPENCRTKVDLMGRQTPLQSKRITVNEQPIFIIAD